ncbi:hypothetical protein Tco_0750905 [Tanacetum coccineum]|uniref:Uncharacterized protein n=1 Tax=Tanacetum coccineum TaxID=301880 RepID=A0ABQ4Z2H5_9ASTR
MDTTRAQQQALDDELVAPADRLKIGKSNLRLSSTLKSKEPTLQVVLDALKLTPFYNAFEISADVPEIYMQEFWVTVSKHHSLLHFTLNGKVILLTFNFRVCSRFVPYIPVIVDYFMSKDQAIPRRNKMFWHHARDEFMFTTVRVISKQQDTQVYSAILLHHLTNQAMLKSEAYMTYRAYATGEKTPKPKTTKKKADSEASLKTKTTQATKGNRIKSSAKGDKAAKKKQPAETSMDKGLTMLSDVALTEAEQLKLVIKRSKTQTHSSHASCSGVNEGTGVKPRVPDVPSYNSDDEQIYWKSNKDNQDDENQDDDDDDDEQTDSDNDGDDFVHPKFSTHDDDARQEEVNEEDSFDPRVQTPSHDESTDDDNSDKETVMTDASLTNVQATQETEDTHVILTAPINPEGQQQSSSVSSGFVSNMLNPRPDTSIDSIFNTEATSLVDVSVTTIVEPPLVFATTLPSPPTPLITHILKTLETDFSEFKQTNQFAKAVSSIPDIVDAYLANKINDAVKIAIQLQSERLRDEAQAENVDFLNKLDDNIKKIIKDQVKEQAEAQTSHAVVANLSELELKKILIGKMEANKSDDRSDIQKNLYKALIDAYNADKDILDAYGDTVTIKRCRDDAYDDEEPSARSNRGPREYEMEKNQNQPEFEIGGTKDQPNEKTSQHPDWLQKPAKLPTPDCDWNKTLPDAHGPIQHWLNSLAQKEDPRESFNEVMDTPLDFSAFMMNRLKVDTLTS